ncbi:SDR family oxidoreductase [Antrihabitans cavernicola]|uniref:Sugar nucleotide-binding protein n=1 Tax=Antrihabitans cavernicola TaxID=2495913 RepID=A0A5A7SFF1_9NOCA|nr:SDR family oxidoreductase [Spelaeibacter cavernicola]KAA0024858.1 sugar nucleotide-binding protein [Spelaeibacter cavernicola]
MTNTVLLTGATGLVGAEVVTRLVDQGRQVVGVTHRTPRIVGNDGETIESVPFTTGTTAPVSHVTGNVREANLGIADPDTLRSDVDLIIHCAATTAFDAPEDEYNALNVDATAHAIALARSWDVPLIYVSTAYVCGRRDGLISESDLDKGQNFSNGYERSKFRAETLVREADGLRWSIVRPGIVTGAADGVVRDYKNLYTVVKLIVEGKLRSLPGRYDATLSLVPVDFVADVIAGVTAQFDIAEGNTFHAVGADALSLREMSDVFAEYPSFAVANFVPTATFSPDDLGDLEREYYFRIGAQYAGYFDRRRTFDATNTATVLNLPLPRTDKEYLRLLLDYCLETGYLGAPLPTIEEALSCLN